METINKCCAGLDVHKKSIVTCIISPKGKEIRQFGTHTDDILMLHDWLIECGCTIIAMESTGVYWKPIYNLLEGSGIEVLVVNAQHIKAVPGRKTDVKDAEWIASLLRHGLLKGSFIPDRPQRELRELVRYRRSLVQEQSREVSRLQKVLEGANIKLSSVISNVMGESGKDMLESLSKGIEDPELLAQLARGNMKKKLPELKKSLRGLMDDHQRFMLKEQLGHIKEIEKHIEKLNKEVAKRMRPFKSLLNALDEIPGVGINTAEDVIAELGTDMSRFFSDRHVASWAGLCPGNNESAGKRHNGKIRRGNKWLRASLVRSAHSASQAKDTYLSSQYHRIASRRGKKRAAVAVAHSILVIVYHILKTGESYKDLGSDFFDKRNEKVILLRTKRKLESLGYEVVLKKVA